MQDSERKSGLEQGAGRVVALDLGEVRTGVAISDPGATLARPLEVVQSGQIEEYLRGIFSEEGVAEVVVGVPRTLGGKIGFQARRTLEKIEILKTRFPEIRFIEKDERFTTKLAVSEPRRKKKGKSRQRVDHLAAARMLQEHLDARGEL